MLTVGPAGSAISAMIHPRFRSPHVEQCGDRRSRHLGASSVRENSVPVGQRDADGSVCFFEHPAGAANRLTGVPWMPGSRKAALGLEEPYSGVPDHLKRPLWNWCETLLRAVYGAPGRAVMAMRMELTQLPIGDLQRACAESDFQLDLVEFLLETQCAQGIYDADWESAELLDRQLSEANSLYQVNSTRSALEVRTLPEVKSRVGAVVDTAPGRAGECLADAWNLAYARDANAKSAYAAAVEAVEAAFSLRVSPNNTRQTLGTMIRDIRAKPTKWKFVIDDDGSGAGVVAVVDLMSLLWERQVRHGTDERDPVSPEEAQAAVHLAATLVQYGVSGAFDLR